jgi:glycosyltransferase involved in cell wall biosynthesis
LSVLRFAILAFRSDCSRTVCYIALSGGPRQYVDSFFILLSMLRGMRVILHHHSFAYLTKRSRRAARVFSMASSATHIVLCERMKSLLTAEYGVASKQITIVSNATFTSEPQNNYDNEAYTTLRWKSDRLRLGFLSNITTEKGIFDFFSILDELKLLGVDADAIVAGPVQPSIREHFDAEIAKRPDCIYIGPIYTDAKLKFFQSIDILVFPSKYVHEAEPVTLWEAMASGVTVVASNIGCIPEMVCSQSQLVELGQTKLFALAILHLNVIPAQTRRALALDRFRAAKIAGSSSLQCLIGEINPEQSALNL